MALLDWPMNLLGYPEHRRSRSTMVGVSHMTLHAAMRCATGMDLPTGWLGVGSSPSPVEGLSAGRPQWVALAELFVENRVANTEGLISGSTVFVSSVPADGPPPVDRSLSAWAEELHRPWVEVVDNELSYWGGLDDERIDRLLTWFLCQRPLTLDWRTTSLAAPARNPLRRGLFVHGWTRNLSQIEDGSVPLVPLWAGVHARSHLAHESMQGFPFHGQGLELSLRAGTWSLQPRPGPCPLDPETGRTVPR